MLNQAATQQQQPQAGGMQMQGPDQGPVPKGVQLADPGQQKQFQTVIAAFGKMLYDPKRKDHILHTMDASDNPVAAAVKLAADLVQQFDRRINMDDGVVLPVAREMMDMLLDLAEEAGLVQMNQDVYMKALQGLMGLLGQAYGTDQSDVAAVHQQIFDFADHQPGDQQEAPNGPAQ